MHPGQRIPVRRQVELTHAGWKQQHCKRGDLHASRNADTKRRKRSNPSQSRSQLETEWTSFERIDELNKLMAFEPLDEQDKCRLENEASEQLKANVLDRKVCVVTDTWVFPCSCTRILVDDLPFTAMKSVLTGEPWTTPHVTQYYDCSTIDPRLHGLLLSSRAFEKGDDSLLYVWITTTILHELQTIATRLNRTSTASPIDLKAPKFAIADGFVAGRFAAIDEATTIERQATSLAQIRGVVKVVYGGPGNVLHSHLLCWDNRNATIATHVPSVVRRENFHLILAGPMTSPQEILLAKRHECSGPRVNRLLELYRQINPLYAHINTNRQFTEECASISTLRTHLTTNDDTELLVQQARARQATVARMNDDDEEPSECTIVEVQTVLLETMPEGTEQDRLDRAFTNVTGTYVATRSTALLKQNDPLFLERLFPHLLTFGTGGFATDRQHRYSQRAVVLHYLNLSTNRFAEDPLFKLAMFDFLSTMRVKTGIYLRVGQDPAIATTTMRVTPDQLKTAMNNRVEQRKAWKRGHHFTPIAESNLASTVLKSINASTSKMWGSNEEREALTRKVDAMTILYGAPSVFWTLTPNPDCSLTCAFWSGHQLPNGRPNHLAECLETNMPCASEMKRLIMTNTVVQATYYKVCCHVLIDVLFGWDMTANKPKSRRGIFGYVEAYLYAMEQQGRLFIHHHGVAWIAGLPKTQADWERLLDNADMKDRFQRYCASIFAAELPIFDAVDAFITCGLWW